MSIDPLLNLDDVVKLTALSKPSIKRLVRLDKFPKPVVIGTNARRWRSRDIKRYIEAAPVSETGLNAGTDAMQRMASD